jgi:hypothetical protein
MDSVRCVSARPDVALDFCHRPRRINDDGLKGFVRRFILEGCRPVCESFLRSCLLQSALTYPALEQSSEPRWRSAQPGPHNRIDLCRAIKFYRFPSCRSTVRPSRFHHSQTSLAAKVLIAQRPYPYAVASKSPTANFSPRRSTAQAIRASLLARATTAIFLCIRASKPFAQRPSGVRRSAR